MKKIYLTVIIIFAIIKVSFAQWTAGTGGNYYLTSGNASIGTAISGGKFLIVGSGLLQNLTNNVDQDLQITLTAGGATDKYAFISPTTATNLTFGVASSEKMRIASSGNVGIGTTNLQAKFNVFQPIGLGGTPQNYSLLSTVSGLAGTANIFQNNIWLVRNAAGNNWYTTRLHDGISIDGSLQQPQVNTATWWERDPSQNIQSWGTAANTYLTINAGNVGIGTTTIPSGFLMAVNGNVIATGVTVQVYSGWPDYVFKKNYHLPSLTEVKTYIDLNQRLPGIPSEKQINKDGINLGEMNKLLVKKVEELTLYMIEKDKEGKEQQEKLNSQQAQLSAQQAQIDKLTKAFEVLFEKQIIKTN